MFLLSQFQKHLDEEMGGLLVVRHHKVSILLESVLSFYSQILILFYLQFISNIL